MKLRVIAASVGFAFFFSAAVASDPTIQAGWKAGWNDSTAVQMAAHGKHYYDPANVHKRAVRKQLTAEHKAAMKAQRKSLMAGFNAQAKAERRAEVAQIKAEQKAENRDFQAQLREILKGIKS
jgi:hypothetical protein